MSTKALSAHIVAWLRDYALKAKTRGFVVGVSGGIDSAVTSLLCAHTGMDTLCVRMPIHQSTAESDRAKQHVETIEKDFENARGITHDLSPVFDAFVAALPADAAGHALSLANSRSRLRMAALYYHAGKRGLLVAGTGNKVEDFGIGFFTKYGDGGVDLSPIADLMKSEVYTLGRHLGVLPSILDAPPTDGLWGDARTDADQIGASYPELEWAMTFTGSEENLSQRQRETLEIYRRLHRQNSHKFRPPPVCEVPSNLR